jgi:hypothetical protein
VWRKKQQTEHASCWFLLWHTLKPRWSRHVSPKRRFTFTGLDGVMSYKINTSGLVLLISATNFAVLQCYLK